MARVLGDHTAAKEPETLTGGSILWTQLGPHASWVTGAFVGGLAGATALGVAVAITFTLRAVPFAMKGALRGSALLADVGRWMPLGAISILAAMS